MYSSLSNLHLPRRKYDVLPTLVADVTPTSLYSPTHLHQIEVEILRWADFRLTSGRRQANVRMLAG